MKQMLAALDRASSDNQWFQKNYLNFKGDYANEFVAIKDKEIIAHAKNLDLIIKILKDKKENPAFILIEFITPKGIEIIL